MEKDRSDLFSVFARDKYPTWRPGALAEFRQLLLMVENELLVDSEFINGREVSVADVHASWMIKWALQTIEVGKEKGFGEEDWPKVYRWIGGMRDHDEKNAPPGIGAEEAKGSCWGVIMRPGRLGLMRRIDGVEEGAERDD